MDLQDTAPADVDAFEKAAGLEVDRLRRAAAGKGLVAESPGHDSEDEIDRQLAEAQRQQKLLEEREQRKEAKKAKAGRTDREARCSSQPFSNLFGFSNTCQCPSHPSSSGCSSPPNSFQGSSRNQTCPSSGAW